MVEDADGSAGGPAPSPPRLTVGGLVAGGRYELLEPHGGSVGLAFWKARDRRLGRTVALTFVDPLPGEEPPGSVPGVLDRTVALTSVYSDGLARVLDVIRGRSGGIVVTEWVPGRSLAATVTRPEPEAAVGALWGLSDAATRAEQAGLVLGLDSPDRVRVTDDGRAVFAFPGVPSGSDPRGDVRGLGAVLYALLSGRWPLELPAGSEDHTPVDGRPAPAPRSGSGQPVDPSELTPSVAPDAAVLALRALDGTAVSSAATVRAMVADRAGAVSPSSSPHTPHPPTAPSPATSQRSSSLSSSAAADPVSGAPAGPPTASVSPSGTPADPVAGSQDAGPDRALGGSDGEPHPGAAPEPDPEVQKRHWMIMAGSGAAAVVVMVLLSVWMLGALNGGGSDAPLSQQLDAIERAARESRAAEAAAPPSTSPEEDGTEDAEPDRAPLTALSVSTVTSWQPASSNGNAENASSAVNVIDGSPATSWSTDTYQDQFGTGPSAYKAGIGLLFTLESPEELREVEVSSPDDLRFEIRSSDTANPTSLDDTSRLGSGNTRGGSGTVEIDDPEEIRYVLVWITRLDPAGPQAYRGSITEVELRG